MVIAHNIAAMNANRQLKTTTTFRGKSCEKLSSGYRINRAADDAAGLSISEKMRKMIRGLDQGSENIQDGISMCQIADGALSEVTEILQRIRELSIQAYNGTNSRSDRDAIQDEIDQGLTEINRIQQTAKFNEKYLFRDGDITTTRTEMVTETETGFEWNTHSFYKGADSFPSWLYVDDKLEPHPAYSSAIGSQGNGSSDVMLQSLVMGPKNYVQVYFGPRSAAPVTLFKETYEYFPDYVDRTSADDIETLMNNNASFRSYMQANAHREDTYDTNGALVSSKYVLNAGLTDWPGCPWTATTSDNYSAKIDFGGLVTNSPDSDTLLKNMHDLIGSSINVPCASCTRTSNICFYGTFENETRNMHFLDMRNSVGNSRIDLTQQEFRFDGKTFTGYFEAIQYVKASEEKEQTDGTLGRPDGLTAATLLNRLKNSIANDLADQVSSKLTQTHFIRQSSTPGSKEVYVYDFRDNNSLLFSSVDHTISKDSMYLLDVYEPYSRDITYPVTYSTTTYDGIKLQASGTASDQITLKLSNISTDHLGITGYSVNKYSTRSVQINADTLPKELAKWEVAYEKYQEEYREWLANRPFHYETRTEEITIRTLKNAAQYSPVWKDGEYTGAALIAPAEYEEKKETRNVTYTVYDDNPDYDRLKPKEPVKPTPKYMVEEYYNPTNLDLLDQAMDSVSELRSYFGAMQNRLEHAKAINDNTSENTQYAESRIRDTDMAEEMLNYSKQNILEQAGHSMLSQAMQMNQGIARLLQ